MNGPNPSQSGAADPWRRPPASGAAPDGRPELDPTIKRALVAVGAVVAAFFVILILRWIVRELLGGLTAFLVLFMLTAGGGYLFYRNQHPQRARELETQVRSGSKAFIDRTITTANSVSAVPPTEWHIQPKRTDSWTTHPTPPRVSGRAPSAGGAISALLLIPTLIAYGVLYGGTVGFHSMWQPWWILTGVNIYFLVCVIARARTGRGVPAFLLGLAGSILIGLSSSPAPEWNLTALLSEKHGYGDYAYSAPPADLVPWIGRAPVLAVILFVLAWGVARRQHGNWVLGMIPTALLVALSVWYREHEWTGEAGWFGWWLMSVGVFIGGCLACWVVDAMTQPRPHTPPPIPRTY